MNESEYIIFCDESDRKGKYFSNFYGGVIVSQRQFDSIRSRLDQRKAELGLEREVKWQRITEQMYDEYEKLVSAFFDEIEQRNLRVRVMFTQNARQAVGLTEEHFEEQYFILYYYFIRHGFGLKHVKGVLGGTKVRLYFDRFPDTQEKVEKFKGYLMGLPKSPELRHSDIVLLKENITEVESSSHILTQCLDIVLGAMCFKLNDKHLIKQEGEQIRGKRTRAKERLYEFILSRIRKIHPNFNIGISTGSRGVPDANWSAAYQHWLFVPNEYKFDHSRTK